MVDPEEGDDGGLLWHYTSASGLMGVLKSSELWASDCTLLNDENELVEGFSVARKVCKDFLKSLNPAIESPLIAEFVSFKDNFLQGHWASDFPIFVASLSFAGNLLSQWRGYCPAGGGYAIGFDPKVINWLADYHKFHFSRCEYHAKDQEAKLVDALEPLHIVRNALEQNKGHGSHMALKSKKMEHRFQRKLLAAIALIKNQGFFEEQEYRLIFPHHVNATRMNFRPARGNGGALIPFVSFSWKCTEAEALPNPVRAIRLGPMPQQQAAKARLSKFLESIGYIGDRRPVIYVSKTPYRT